MKIHLIMDIYIYHIVISFLVIDKIHTPSVWLYEVLTTCLTVLNFGLTLPSETMHAPTDVPVLFYSVCCVVLQCYLCFVSCYYL